MESVIGIDAGGSRIRAIAVAGDTVVRRGAAGPGNPHALSDRELAAHYSTALAGFPPARSVAVCAAGAGARAGRKRLRRVLDPLLGGARLTVLPDYAAAWMAAPAATDVVVIAGTGSVVASPATRGETRPAGAIGVDSAPPARLGNGAFTITGGAGVAGGDPGSAVRIGGAALARRGVDPGALPAVEVGCHATVVTAAAERGERWAVALLEAAIAPLADDVRRHAARVDAPPRTRVAVTGGVFASPASVVAFESAAGPRFEVVPLAAEPVVGAARIARELAA